MKCRPAVRASRAHERARKSLDAPPRSLCCGRPGPGFGKGWPRKRLSSVVLITDSATPASESDQFVPMARTDSPRCAADMTAKTSWPLSVGVKYEDALKGWTNKRSE